MSYQNKRLEKIQVGTPYNPLFRETLQSMHDYVEENRGEVRYQSLRNDKGEFIGRYEYCLTVPELRGQYKKRKNKSWKRVGYKATIKNYHKTTRATYKKRLKNLNDDVDLKGVGWER